MQGDPDETAELDGSPDPEELLDDEAPEGDEIDADAAEDDEPELSDDEDDESDLDDADADLDEAPEPELLDESDEPVDEDADAEPAAYEPWAPKPRNAGSRWLARLLVLAAVLIPAVVIVGVIRQATGEDEPTVDARLADRLRYDGEGNPYVLAPIAKVGAVSKREWRVCGAECDAVSGRGKEFQPGEVLAGSRVEVKVTGERGDANLVSPNWDGQLQLIDRPTLTGSALIGSTITANPGKWTGGWIGGRALLGVRACPTKAGGAKCIAFTSSIIDDRHKPARTIPESFRGWWIGAIEWQIPPGRKLDASAPDPDRPQSGRQAPQRSVAVGLGPLDGPIR